MSERKSQGKGRRSGNPGMALMRSFNIGSNPNHIIRARLHRTGTISSNVLGNITQTLDFNPSNATDWGDFSSTYDEFRVLAVKLELIPAQQGSVTAVNGLVAVAFDNDENGPLGSVDAALDYETNYKLSSIWYANQGRPLTMAFARPSSGSNTAIAWCDVGAPATSVGAAKFGSTVLSTSTTYFTYVQEYFLEFRGRR